jgi:hypothetical protein
MVQARKRSIFSFVLYAALALGAGAALLQPTVARADDDEGDASGPCTTKPFNFPAVEKACKEGGRKAAKKLMNEVKKKAKAAGKEFKCKGCHEDLKSYKLTDNAVKDLKPFM